MSPWRIDRTLVAALIVLLAVFGVFELSHLDIAVQDHLFDFARGRWLIDAQAPVWRFWLYNLPKWLIIALGVALLALAVGPARWRARWPIAAPARRQLWVAFLTIGAVPTVIGQLKATTNIFCPSEVRRYGGDVPYVRVIECYPENDTPTRRGRCWPAGHASGGFALLALMGLARTRRGQRIGLALGLGAGGLMGFYQMAKGAHYLSHTLITALLAWIGFLLMRRAFGVHRLRELSEPGDPSGSVDDRR